MTGSLMQLVAYGSQDVYLTGNPQISFFKVVYKRHTNFAIESIEVTPDGNAKLGTWMSCVIVRNADLVSQIILEVDWDGPMVPSTWRLGHQIIEYVEVEIGGLVIDKHYGVWMDIWTQLTHTYQDMNKLSGLLSGKLTNNNGNSKLYIPLQFWFCRNPGLALPLIALQYHEVKINIQFSSNYVYANPLNNQQYINSDNTTPSLSKVAIFCDYIFLDTDERRRFAQVSHEYLIEQIQYSNILPVTPGPNQIEMHFNHPVKEIIWALQRTPQTSTETLVSPFDFWQINTSVVPPLYDIDLTLKSQIKLNSLDRFKRREGTYFRCVQPYQYHTGGDRQVGFISPIPVPYYDYLVEPFGGFYMYSFALNPEDHQPSGTCNFSRIDNSILSLDLNTQVKNIRIWAVNYNILRIMSGMGGVAYSN
jgi:hypothetical protein